MLDASPPAASLFKLVTSAALLEHGVVPETSTCYHGGASGLTMAELVDNPKLDTAQVIMELGKGEALVSFLEGNGTPSMVERVMIRPPSARIGPITPEERKAIIDNSPVKGKYDTAIDAESAYEILQKRVADLAKEKDAAGHAYKRGVYSKSYQRVDDSTYTVGMHVATAGPEQMKVERYTLTLVKNADGTWAITKEDLKDSYDKMWRTVVPEAPFFAFDSVSFEREGLKVTGGAGTLYKIQQNKSDFSYVASAALTVRAIDSSVRVSVVDVPDRFP